MVNKGKGTVDEDDESSSDRVKTVNSEENPSEGNSEACEPKTEKKK